jgi:hypothetical protein
MTLQPIPYEFPYMQYKEKFIFFFISLTFGDHYSQQGESKHFILSGDLIWCNSPFKQLTCIAPMRKRKI